MAGPRCWLCTVLARTLAQSKVSFSCFQTKRPLARPTTVNQQRYTGTFPVKLVTPHIIKPLEIQTQFDTSMGREEHPARNLR